MYSIARDYTRSIHHASNAYMTGIPAGRIVDLQDVVRYGGPSLVRWYTHISLQYSVHGIWCVRFIWGAALDVMRDELTDTIIETVGPNRALNLLETDPCLYAGDIHAKLVYAVRTAIRNSLHRCHASAVYEFMRYIFNIWGVSAFSLLRSDTLQILVNDNAINLLSLLNVYAIHALWPTTVTSREEQLQRVRLYRPLVVKIIIFIHMV